jgi:hypothetical protein
VVGHFTDLRKCLVVGHLPPLGDVGHAVGAVGREQGRRLALDGVRVLPQKSDVHGSSLLEVGETFSG